MTSSLLWLLLCLLLPALLLNLITYPSCSPAPTVGTSSSSSSLKVAVVADLHLAGPGTHWFDRFRRESFLQSTFRKIYWKLKPDALVVLGDVSDAGRKSNDAQWDAVVSRFWSVIGPFAKGPLQVVVGNHDVGDHHDQGMQARLPRFAASFPGLDPTCCSRYNWKLIDFISLNAMAMQGDRCSLCSDVEKVVEKHSVLVQQHGQNRSHNNRSGPVLLLHLPLYREDDSACNSLDVPRCAPWHELEGSCLGVMASPPPVATPEEPYKVGQDVLPPDVSKYVLEALKPRLVLNGHTHRWCDHIHEDGTREITVSSLTWRNRDDPSFVIATFDANSSIHIQHCMLAHESTVLTIYLMQGVSILIWALITGFVAHQRHRSKNTKPE
ncbi:unnamed protein product [Sphagnum troendelagicum]